MKRFLLLAISISLLAIPDKMSFQGRLLDDYGNPHDGELSATIRIYDSETGGSLLYTESRTISFNAGLFSIMIGDITPLSADIFDCAQPYIEFTVDGETLPRQPLSTDAYAFRSAWADSTEWVNLDTLGAYLDTTLLSLLPLGPSGGQAAFHVEGEPWFSDSLTLVPGANIDLTQIGRDIRIDADVPSTAAFKAYGSSWISDSLVLIGGSNVSLSQSGREITINATTSGGTGSDEDWTISGSNIYSAVGGNVGIGTDSPAMKLHVTGDVFSEGRLFSIGMADATNGDTVIVYQGGELRKYVPDMPAEGFWSLSDSVLQTSDAYGIARGNSGNLLYGGYRYTHVNLGTASRTGESGFNREYCTVGGGSDNTAKARYTTVSGGKENYADGDYSFIGGGIGNQVEHRYAVVAGGDHNEATYLWSTVGGGYYNQASESYAVVAGGGYNDAIGWAASIGGGNMNVVTGDAGTVSGGKADTVSGNFGTVGGGYANSAGNAEGDTAATVAGGWSNKAMAIGAAIGGGIFNRAEGDFSCIPGGSFLAVGERSFGFRGGIGGNPSTLLDLSGQDESFFIADAEFHFNPTNANADFRVDGTSDNMIKVDALLNRVTINTGTTSPYLFYVNGSAAKPGSGTWTVYSDGRLKENVADYTYGLDAIANLRPVNYNYKEDNPLEIPSDETHTGIIAQELMEVIPEAVEKTENGYYAVDTDPVIWALVNAVKELKKQNEELKERIEGLEKSKDK